MRVAHGPRNREAHTHSVTTCEPITKTALNLLNLPNLNRFLQPGRNGPKCASRVRRLPFRRGAAQSFRMRGLSASEEIRKDFARNRGQPPRPVPARFTHDLQCAGASRGHCANRLGVWRRVQTTLPAKHIDRCCVSVLYLLTYVELTTCLTPGAFFAMSTASLPSRPFETLPYR